MQSLLSVFSTSMFPQTFMTSVLGMYWFINPICSIPSSCQNFDIVHECLSLWEKRWDFGMGILTMIINHILMCITQLSHCMRLPKQTINKDDYGTQNITNTCCKIHQKDMFEELICNTKLAKQKLKGKQQYVRPIHFWKTCQEFEIVYFKTIFDIPNFWKLCLWKIVNALTKL